jgi:hypothetical protein
MYPGPKSILVLYKNESRKKTCSTLKMFLIWQQKSILRRIILEINTKTVTKDIEAILISLLENKVFDYKHIFLVKRCSSMSNHICRYAFIIISTIRSCCRKAVKVKRRVD